jgi:protein involved in sex pheromone biosynthesis
MIVEEKCWNEVVGRILYENQEMKRIKINVSIQ